MDIGEKIKERRLFCNLTQVELANRCELTKGYISQLENDKADPSIQTLELILHALGTNFTDFFNEAEKPQIKFSEAEQLDTEFPGYTQSWLVPTSQSHAMEPIYIILKPHSKTIVDLPHEGEEFGYILRGSIALHYGDEEVKCNAGESFYYKTNRKHYLENLGEVDSEIIWVSCPPNF